MLRYFQPSVTSAVYQVSLATTKKLGGGKNLLFPFYLSEVLWRNQNSAGAVLHFKSRTNSYYFSQCSVDFLVP